MTNKQKKFDRDEYVFYVLEKLRERAKNKSLKSETDFLMGAAAVFYHLGIPGEMPSGWIFGPLSGKSVMGNTCKGCFKTPADSDDPTTDICHSCQKILG